MSFHTVGNHVEGLGKDPRNYIGNLEQIIGRLPDHIKHDFAHNQSRTFGDLTELLLSRATPVVQQQVTGLLKKSYVSPYTQILLPIRELGPYESINVKWTEVNFNEGIANQVEVLGIGRTHGHNKTRRGARAVRRGAAVEIESGFFMTPEGQHEWKQQIEQLVTIIQNTNELDVLLTLLQTPMRSEVHASEMNGPYNHIYGANNELSFDERFELERDMAFIVNKSEDSRGFNSLVTNLATVMKRNGVEPDAMIVPPYMLGYYYTTNDDLWHHSSAGPSAAINREMAADIGGDSAFRSRTIQGIRLIDTYIYRPTNGNRGSVCDLLTTPFQIGEYYPLEVDMVHRDKKSFRNYSSSDRDARIFNEDHSRFAPVYFIDGVKNSHRFDHDSGELLSNYENVNNDMFLCNGNEECKTWGDMELAYLSIDNIKKVVITVVNAFTPSERDEFNSIANVGDKKVSKYITRLNKIFPSETKLAVANGKYKIEYKRKDGKGRTVHDSLLSDSNTFLEQTAAAMFLSSKITLQVIEAMHDNDVLVPVDVILTRPWMTYNMSSVVIMKAGSETGETIIGQQDFQMSSNTQDRRLKASYVYYGKAIVKNSRNVIVAPRVFCQGYKSGNNLKYVSTDTLNGEIHDRSGIVDSDESIFALLVPMGSNVRQHNWIDIRGSNVNVADRIFHPSKDYYSTLLGIDDNDIASPTNQFVDYEDMDFSVNTLCWHGHIEYGPGFSMTELNMGHLGPNTYDQVNHSRKEGIFSPVKRLTYNTKVF